MYDMLIFITFTVLFLVANVAMGKFMLIAIQEGQLFDTLFNWQGMLNWLYGRGKFGQLVEKFLGGCAICFLHFVSIINYVFYMVFMTIGLDNLPMAGNIWLNIIWYFVYVSIGWYFSMRLNIDKE